MLSCLSTGTARHATPPSPLRGDEQFPFFTSSSSFWERQESQPQLVERERMLTFISSFHLFANLAKRPACQPSPAVPARLLLLLPPPGSRGGRPVSVGPIGKQRPKMCFPVSSPSSTSKHSNRPWKNVAKPSCWPAIFAHDDFHRCRAASSSAKI